MKTADRGSCTVRLRHALGSVELVLGTVGLKVAPDLGRAEEEDLVGRGRDVAGAVAALVVSHLSDGEKLRPHPRPERIEAASRFKTYAFHHERGICHELETEKMRYRLTDFGDSDVFRRLNRRQYQTATRCLSLIFVH